MAKVLFLSNSPEMLKADHGGRQRSLNLVKALSKEHTVTVLSLSWNKISYDKNVDGIKFISVPLESNVISAAKKNKIGLTRYNPDILIDYYTKFAKGYIKKMNDFAVSTDLIVVDQYSIAPMIKMLKYEKPIIYSSHNCETDLFVQMLGANSIDTKAVHKIESKILEKSSSVVYCSKEDLNKINEYFLINKPTYYVPNGTDIPSVKCKQESKQVLFVGSGHPPNWVAIKRIIDIAKRLPEYKFVIAGTSTYIVDEEKIILPSNVIKYSEISNEEVEKLFQESSIFINPVESGSGTHLKILKALAYGMPIVTTNIGARGLSEKDKKESLVVVETNDEMVDAVKQLLSSKEYDRVSSNAIKLSEQYDWNNIHKLFLKAVNDTLNKTFKDEKEMISKKILVYSIMRNEAGYIDEYHRQLKDFVEAFPEHTFYLSVYENDSIDNTKAKLKSKDWSFFADTSFIHETLNTVFYRSTKEDDRVKNLANARNKAIEAKDFLQKSDLIIMVEGDVAYNLDTAKTILRFTEAQPDFDVVSGITIRNDRLYDVWATRTSAEYIKGVLPLHDDYHIKAYGKYYSTSNGICIYKSQPFKDGIRYDYINSVTGQGDCEMVVICQRLREAGHDNVYILHNARIYHEHY